MQSVSILGLGWLGEAYADYLFANHYKVSGSKRINNLEKPYPVVEWTLGDSLSSELISDVAVISIANRTPNLDDYRKLFLELSDKKTTKVIFISSTSVYDGLEGELFESSSLIKTERNAHLILLEELFLEILPHGTILRLAGLIGPKRNPANFLSGKENVPNPNQLVNLVHREDVISAIDLAMNSENSGIFNICASSHPSRVDFYTKCCDAMGLKVPVFSTDTEKIRWVSNAKSKNVLNLNYRYDNLYKDYLNSLIKA